MFGKFVSFLRTTFVPILGWAAGLAGAGTSGYAYWRYAGLIATGATTNVATWVMWTFESVLSGFVQKDQSDSDLPKYAEEIVAALGCASIALILVVFWLGQGRDIFGPLDPYDFVSAAIFVIALGVYMGTRHFKGDTLDATIVFQLVIASSAFPLFWSAFQRTSHEPLWPWVLWTGAFLMQAAAVLFRQNKKGDWYAVITPLHYAAWHGLVAGTVLLRPAFH